MQSKIVVTGGAGFIGSHIVDELVKRGDIVAVIDDLSSGNREQINTAAKFHQIDIKDSRISEIIREFEPDFVIHQAAQINVRKSVEDPIFDMGTNIGGSLNLMQALIDTDVKRVVFASSGGAIYGNPPKLPADESCPENPVCPYGVAKLAFEKYLFYYAENYGIDFVNLRYSNVYGPRQDPKGEAGVVAIFINNLMEDRVPTIFGDGEQTRDFVYVEDVAKANVLALSNGKNVSVNVGVNEETSVNDLFMMISNVLEPGSKAAHGQERLGEVRRIRLDNRLAKKTLGWVPEVEIHEGLKRTVDWFKKWKR